MLLLLEAQEGNWDEIDLMVRAFQGATMALKYAEVPVVVAPAGLTLGGGCEIALHGDRVQAAAETYMGLVEVGVGLIPAGGGTKEMLARAIEDAPAGSRPAAVRPARVRDHRVRQGLDERARRAAPRLPARRRRDHDESRAPASPTPKRVALARAADYVPRGRAQRLPVGGEGVQAALKLGVHLAWRAGRISDHDALIGRKLAGSSPAATRRTRTVTEQQLLDLEREAFLSLCGERKTQERIGTR